MITYISILRGINVSGHRMIKMDALRLLFSELGFQHIQTYIQSGNVVFQDTEIIPLELEIKIKEAIAEKFGFDVPVIIIKLNELSEIIADNPFLKDAAKDINHLHATFLAREPAQECLDKIKEVTNQTDEFHIIGKAIYLYCPNGYGNSKLTNTFFENKLKVTATTRNWKTINELSNIAERISDLQ